MDIEMNHIVKAFGSKPSTERCEYFDQTWHNPCVDG